MPTMASLTVKKYDETTNIVYDAVSASGGDGSPAVFRQDTGAPAALPVGLRPHLKLWTQWNGPKTARQVKYEMVFPYAVQDTTTTLYSAKDRIVHTGIMTVPQGVPATHINESVTQAFNLLATSLVKQTGHSGYAPT